MSSHIVVRPLVAMDRRFFLRGFRSSVITYDHAAQSQLGRRKKCYRNGQALYLTGCLLYRKAASYRGILRSPPITGIACCARRERPRGGCAAEGSQQFSPSDGDCHTPLPREVRRGKDSTP